MRNIIKIAIVLSLISCACSNKNDNMASTQSGEVPSNATALTADSSTTTAIDTNRVAVDEKYDKIMVVDFYATWCGPCKAMAPTMEAMENKYGNKIEFNKVDIDQSPEIAQEFNVTAVPTIVVISRTGDIIETLVGLQSKERLDQLFGSL
jgi:thioredoxin 1